MFENLHEKSTCLIIILELLAKNYIIELFIKNVKKIICQKYENIINWNVVWMKICGVLADVCVKMMLNLKNLKEWNRKYCWCEVGKKIYFFDFLNLIIMFNLN